MKHFSVKNPKIASMRRFAKDARASVGILFGFAVIPLILLTGGGVDYLRATTARSALFKAADGAALTAARNAAQMVGNGQANWSAASADIGSSAFNSSSNVIQNVVSSTPTVAVSRNGQTITAQLSFTASVQTAFLTLLQMASLPIGGTVTASVDLPQYSNLSLVLDVSPSMAIGATAADIANLKSLTQAQTGTACGFACHDTDGSAAITNYQIARNGNVNLRIDIVKTAAQALTNYVASSRVTPGQYTLGLYSLSSALKTLAPPTSNLSAISTAIGAVDFDTMSSVVPTLPAPAAANIASGTLATHYADTDYAATFSTLSSALPVVGTGASPGSRQQFVFIVTDGVSDTGLPDDPSVNPTYSYPPVPSFSTGNGWGKVTSPIDPSLCDALKARGVKIGVLYVTYVADTTDLFYQIGVQTNAPPANVQANLTACASPNLFYQASDLPSLTAGLRTLFDNATLKTVAHLTQ